jgi:hypothetical protein
MKTIRTIFLLSIIGFLLSFHENKVYSQITSEWFKNFNGTVNDWDEGVDMALDNDENILVLGFTTNNETVQDFDITVLKYDKNGNLIWEYTKDLDGNNFDEPTAMAIDINNNIYVTGKTDNSMSKIFTLKLNESGEHQWTKYFTDNENPCESTSIIVNNNIYVCGYGGIVNDEDIILLQYDFEGNLLWDTTYSGTGNGSDITASMCFDASENIIICGSTGESGGYAYTNIVTLAYNSEGNLLWENEYQGPSASIDIGTGICSDQEGNVYAIGTSEKMVSGQPETDYAVIKYNENGIEQWVTRYDGGYGNDWPVKCIFSETENLFVTGWSISENDTKSAATVKLDTEGNKIWDSRYDGLGYYFNNAYDIIEHSTGYILIAGIVQVDEFNNEWILHVIDPEGTEITNSRFSGDNKSIDTPFRIIEDSEKNIYMSGFTTNLNTGWDITTVKYAVDLSSTDYIEQNSIKVYPNPSDGVFVIETENSYMISVSDITGKKIIDIETINGKTEIDLSAYSNGVYFMEFRNKDILKVTKIIKK